MNSNVCATDRTWTPEDVSRFLGVPIPDEGDKILFVFDGGYSPLSNIAASGLHPMSCPNMHLVKTQNLIRACTATSSTSQ
jgi:hypothetical protein